MPESPVTVSRAVHFATLYANNIQVRLTLWDVQLLFGQIKHASQPGTAEISAVEQHTAMTLSPPTAKALMQSLQAHIDAYEHLFGEIRLEQIGGLTIDPKSISLQ